MAIGPEELRGGLSDGVGLGGVGHGGLGRTRVGIGGDASAVKGHCETD